MARRGKRRRVITEAAAPPTEMLGSHFSCNQEETLEIAQKLAKHLLKGDFIALGGPLGAGKTTFVKGLISALCGMDIYEIASPTFSYLNTYRDLIDIHHFDLYRIRDEEHLSQLGLYDYLTDKNAIRIVEWPEKSKLCQSLCTIKIDISYQDQTVRHIKIHRGP